MTTNKAIFHTNSLVSGAPSRNPDDILKQRFADVGRVPQAFSSIKYIGTRTYAPPTDFNGLKKTVREHLGDNAVRSARSPQIIFNVLMVISYLVNTML